jgi:hypothetical protein
VFRTDERGNHPEIDRPGPDRPVVPAGGVDIMEMESNQAPAIIRQMRSVVEKPVLLLDRGMPAIMPISDEFGVGQFLEKAPHLIIDGQLKEPFPVFYSEEDAVFPRKGYNALKRGSQIRHVAFGFFADPVERLFYHSRVYRIIETVIDGLFRQVFMDAPGRVAKKETDTP